MIDGSPPKDLCFLKHNDGAVWLVICICTLVQQSGNIELLDKEVEFKDSDEKATVYKHLLKAVDHLAGYTGEHGLCLMGDGDWTDPINGIGRLGKGESTWTTLALKYSILHLLPLCKKRGDKVNIESLEKLEQRLDEVINSNCWDGDWYIGGYDDFGVPFATSDDEEAKVFLNAQTWAIMSRAAKGERLEKCINAIRKLDTPCGPLLLWPEFSSWNKRWGRISIKLAGTTENGSVYCHASMFKSYADCIAGNREEAYETIRKTLPTNEENPHERSLQIPIFVPNYYFGLKDSPDFGRSSQNHSTGTAAWMLWVTVECLLGVKATIDGLEINPYVLDGWESFKLDRVYKNARYSIIIKKTKCGNTGVEKIKVNGKEIKDNILPYEDGKNYLVEVNIS